MKHTVKRSICVLLVMLLCVSLLSGLTFAASVNYQTGNPEGFSNVILNWGKRGTTATFLSPNAESFYSDNNVTYGELAELQGASSVSAVPNSELYGVLHDLMADNHSKITSYGETRPLYSYTDCQESNRNLMTCFYSGKSIGPNWDSGATWNREHTWPNSKGMDGSDEDDIMMLRPANSSDNSSRGNSAYGESSGFFDPNSVSNHVYNLHGDVARIALYVYVRWGNTEKLLGSDGVIESLDVLLRWMQEDPVDTWEMGRNDSVESITGTRNVFVDYPELAFVLFNEDVPGTMASPSGEAINGGITYTITALSNNEDWGTVSVSGKTVNAAPKTGYLVEGYTLVSGEATVTRTGNAFEVDADSDCTVQINFAARESVYVGYMENGNAMGHEEVYVGDPVTLPECTVEIPEGYTFQGWVDTPLSETTEKPARILKAGSTVTAETDVTYYALYSRLDAQAGGSSTAYELVSGGLDAGNYLIVYNDGNNDSAMAASVSDKGRMNLLRVTPVGNAIDNPDASIIWELAFTADGYVTLYNKSTGSYVAGTGVNNKAKLLTSVTDFAKWIPEGEGPYELLNLGNKNKGNNYYLRRNSDFGFACYTQSTGGALSLYKQSTGTLYYSTVAEACEHANVKDVEQLNPTCTEVGYTAGVFCEDCKSYISGHAQIPAPGHAYEGVVTPPTVTLPGYTTYTCTVCGDTYSGDFTEALGEQYNVSFVVPEGVEPIADQLCGKNGITLPTAGDVEGYTFAGWVETQLDDTTDAPTLYTGTYTAKAETTLYALYTYITGASGEVSWKLVTDAANLSAGDSVVLAQNVKQKVAAEIYSQYLTDVDAVFSEDGTEITTLPETALVFTLGKSEDVWTLTCSGKQLCATALKKVAWDRGTNSWTITVDENNDVTLASTNESYGRFLYNVNSPRFTTYTSKPSVSMLMPQLYKLEGDLGTTHYTTNPGAPVEEGVTVSGTVTTSGLSTDAITVELWAEGTAEAAYTATAENGSYAIENVAPGSYTLKISQTAHATRSYAVTVEAEDVTVDGKICPIGDVTGDGKINIMDVVKLYAHVKGTPITDEYALACGDVSGDGKINIMDVVKLYAHVKGVTPLF